MPMRYKAVVAYLGTVAHGWQRQSVQTSVQALIEKAISEVEGKPVTITGAGRTDAGVHAHGQVFHVDLERPLPQTAWLPLINQKLPKGILLYSLETVAQTFHARYDATGKHYAYLIHTGAYDLFWMNRAWQIQQDPDVSLLLVAADILTGTHDYASFTNTSYKEMVDQVRTIHRIDVSIENQIIRLDFYGTGFMRYMVRMLSAAIIDCGLRKLSSERLQMLLDQPDKQGYSGNAPAMGLYLEKVYYDSPIER